MEVSWPTYWSYVVDPPGENFLESESWIPGIQGGYVVENVLKFGSSADSIASSVVRFKGDSQRSISWDTVQSHDKEPTP